MFRQSMRMFLWATLASIATLASAGVAAVRATDDALHLVPEPATIGTSIRVLALPPYELSQEWVTQGAGGVFDVSRGLLRFTFTSPGASAFDPFISNPRVIDATTARHLALRVRLTGSPNPFPLGVYGLPWQSGGFGATTLNIVPTVDWQIVRADLGTLLGANWTGNCTLRLDPAEAAASVAAYSSTVLEVDWIAVTSDPAYNGAPMSGRNVVWKFDYSTPVYTGIATTTVTLPRRVGSRDLLYARLQLMDSTGATPLGSGKFVSEWGDLARVTDDSEGWFASGYGMTQSLMGDTLRLNFINPSPSAFDPYCTNNRLVNATHAQNLTLRLRMTGTTALHACQAFGFTTAGQLGVRNFSFFPTGNWQIVRVPMTGFTGQPWTGERSLRIDFFSGAGWSAAYQNVAIDIDWIALTDESTYNGSGEAGDDVVWHFRADRSFDFSRPSSIKGLQVQMVDDAIALGVRTAGINIPVTSVLDFSAAPLAYWEVDGQRIGVNIGVVQYYDGLIRELTDAGIAVYGILINTGPRTPDPGNPQVHPRTDLAGSPNTINAFNITDELGYRSYRAVVELLGSRYTLPGAPFGHLRGLIIGNEIQSHWYWHNLGLATDQQVIDDYSKCLRVAGMGLLRAHPQLLPYISMEHHWAIRYGGNALQAMTGRSLLEGMRSRIAAEGDLPWALAFHPYPEDLFDPKFWFDTSATMSGNTSRITFKNAEVIEAILDHPDYRHRGTRRPLIFSEQGFHTPNNASGQRVQAAAYAYAWRKLSNMPSLEAFILHRHVDFRDEGGLNLGLWTRSTTTTEQAVPLAKKESWFVFRDADTPAWPATFAPYLAETGLASWDDALPARTGIHFLFDADAEGWTLANEATGGTVSGGALRVNATGGDPFLRRASMFFFGDAVEWVRIRMSTTAGPAAQLFWTTSAESGESEDKSIVFPLISDGLMHDYLLPISHAKWQDQEIRSLRLDPTRDAAGAQIAIDSIEGGLGSPWRSSASSAWLYE